jgi:hypothetical protein
MNFIYFLKFKINQIKTNNNYIYLKFIIIWIFLLLIILILYYFLSLPSNKKYFVNPDINNYSYHLNDNDLIKIKNNIDNDIFNKNYFNGNINKIDNKPILDNYHNNINDFESKPSNNNIDLNNILNYVNTFPKNNYNDEFNIEI